MKAFIVATLMTFSFSLMAGEVATFKADLNVIKCEDECIQRVIADTVVEVEINPSGEYTFRQTVEDHTIVGQIYITKAESISKYIIQAYVNVEVDGDLKERNYLGVVAVNSLKELNLISWRRDLMINGPHYNAAIVIRSAL